ncbi:uncharacterized protein LOC131007848 [Salvia miltiorrhiza]|uniref:uncharacterized protein LOC131007848 n=1 Tax=Salvia miltiorrhiza TaxID=226208 RepID=UPI0025AC842E|nr:uncharacterized protein LOC131007848 [Salvia miltiorrhiza]
MAAVLLQRGGGSCHQDGGKILLVSAGGRVEHGSEKMWRSRLAKNLEWSRPLLERELTSVHSLKLVIENARLREGQRDGWHWKASQCGTYTVKSAYREICSRDPNHSPHGEEFAWLPIWKAPVPLKVITTVWRALRDRLPTCDNLVKRQLDIHGSDLICAHCNSGDESVEHIFSTCGSSAELWKGLLRWFGKESALPTKLKDHLLAFTNLGTKQDVQFLLGVWMCTIWSIWRGRNNCKFNLGTWNIDKLLKELKRGPGVG